MSDTRKWADAVMPKLKDFQRRTVDYVFKRLYKDEPNHTRRFLVADEVGLGKTLVARGVIAKTLDHLDADIDRIDVVYVCSNAVIAQQNINKLNVTGDKHTAMATRLTLLPIHLKGLLERHVNFVSFTPGTTFDLKSRGGIAEERALLYYMLRDLPDIRHSGLRNLLRCTVSRDNWHWWTTRWKPAIEITLQDRLLEAVKLSPLHDQLGECAEVFWHGLKKPSWPDNDARYKLIGRLRHMLAEVCVDVLEPDLVILDEFQRFKGLLHGDDEAAQLAQSLMNYQDDFTEVRVLLLSATPYRMYTLNTDEEDNHYADFMETVGFLLQRDQGRMAEVEAALANLRQVLLNSGPNSGSSMKAACAEVQRLLSSVMVRTERVSSTVQRDSLLVDCKSEAPLLPADLRQAAAIGGVSRALGAGDAIEYWKSSPYLLNMMKRSYVLKRKLADQQDHPSDELLARTRKLRNASLNRRQFERYRRIDPGNARLRSLMGETIDKGQWQHLWLPPCLPYWKPSGVFANAEADSKALIFSSWNVVPDTVATMCSYEAERRMVRGFEDLPAYSQLSRKKRGLLRYRLDKERRPAGMMSLMLAYPCATLAERVDPVELSLGHDEGLPSADWVRHEARKIVASLLEQCGVPFEHSEDGRADHAWYWVSLALLDGMFFPEAVGWAVARTGWRKLDAEEGEDDSDAPAEGDDETRFVDHLDLLGHAANLVEQLGHPPADLVAVLADLALAGPGVCGLRGLRRVAPTLGWDSGHLLKGAARVSAGFLSLFNGPDSMGLLERQGDDRPYWRRALQYCADGNLQSVLDEYMHVLRDGLGLFDHEADAVAAGVSKTVREVLSIRTPTLVVDELRVSKTENRIETVPFRVRCNFALRYGEIKDDSGKTLARAGTVREAFNSPFRPFILATTSIGQEGLDFHPYCHVVYHWNLPSNPVDLEQREGRVHRYKGHAIRKNVAREFGLMALRGQLEGCPDPWDVLFRLAAESRPDNLSELVPYWLFEVENGVKVERRVPMLPFSREEIHLDRLKRGLALYRLVFGQPRQEDLLNYIDKRYGGSATPEKLDDWRISLEPPAVRDQEE